MVQLGIRPEALDHINRSVDLAHFGIGWCDRLGADTYLIINCGDLGQVTVRASGENALEPGAQVGLAFSQDKLHYFDGAGNAL